MKMGHPISDTFHLAQSLNPAGDAKKVKTIDYGSDFKDIIDKLTS